MANRGQSWGGAFGILFVSLQVVLGAIVYVHERQDRISYLALERQALLLAHAVEVRLGELAGSREPCTGEGRAMVACGVGPAALAAASGLGALPILGYEFELWQSLGSERHRLLASGGVRPEGAASVEVRLPAAPLHLVLWAQPRDQGGLPTALAWGGALCLGLGLLAWFWIDRQLAALELAALRQTQRHAALFAALGEGVVVLADGPAGFLLHEMNPAAERLFGVATQAVKGQSLQALFGSEGALFERVLGRLRTEAFPEGVHAFEWRRSEGSVWLEFSALCFPDDGYVLVFRDVSERRRSEESLRLYQTVFRGSGEAMLVTDRGNRIIEVNPAFCRLTGYSNEEVRGEDPRILASGVTPPETYRQLWQSLAEHDMWQGELWDRHRSGHLYPKWTVISVVRNWEGEIGNYIATFVDISERKAHEEQVRHQAYHDSLTGLPNRLRFRECLQDAYCAAGRSGTSLTLLFIDLDGFKAVNDCYGHQVGDWLLVEVGSRLRTCLRESDFVARLGGDEFVVMLPGSEHPGEGARVAEKILVALRSDYPLAGQCLRTTPSIGIASYPQNADTPEELLRQADLAMYRAKQRGKSCFHLAGE